MIDADGNLTLERENAVVPRDEVRLSKDLHKLFEMGVIMKTKDKRYQIFAGTEDIMSTAIHQRVLRNFVNVEKARAVAIQQGKITASDLLNAHITMGNTTVYSNIFMSKKSSRCNYETEVQRIAEKFNQVMDELYSLIRQHSIKDFNIHHPPVTVVIDEPWRRNPEEEKAVFSKDMEEIKKLRPEYAKQMQRMLNLKEKKSSNRPYNSKQNW